MNLASDTSLAGQVAFVTGGASGLGAAICRRLAGDGALVVVNDINADAAHTLASELDGRAQVFDVSNSAAFDTAVDAVVAELGRLDILVNNAGIGTRPDEARSRRNLANLAARSQGRLTDLVPLDATVSLTDEEFDRMMKVHLYGTFHGLRAALRHMTPARRGSIVNIASVLGLRPMAGPLHYSAAKAAIIALTKSCGQEMAPFGVRINAVCPGWIDTPLLAPTDAASRAATMSQIPQARFGDATEVADLVHFLVGPRAGYCSGDVLSLSGGVV